MRISFFIACLLLWHVVVLAQVIPAEGARLHYRIIGFSFPAERDASEYRLEVAQGHYSNGANFSKQSVQVNVSKDPHIIVEVPKFGQDYTWRSSAKIGARWVTSGLHYFTTVASNLIDSVGTRLTVKSNARRYSGMYFFVDANKALYDINGKMVWYVPDSIAPTPGIQDLKLSPQGTITFEYRSGFYEITYDGKLIKKLPVGQGTTIDGFHHEVRKRANGHYMGLGNRISFIRLGANGYEVSERPDSTGGYKPVAFEVLNEYDENGRLIWQYNILDYLLTSDIKGWVAAGQESRLHPHVNAFFFDEGKSEFYLGCRDINRIIKFAYPSGKVLGEYGRKYHPGTETLDQDLFCQQHAVNVLGEEIFVFNNNGCSADHIPRIICLRKSPTSEYGVEKVWEYTFNVKPMEVNRSRGGNVIPLDDGSVFSSIGTPWGQLVIVDRKGNLLWQAIVERWDPGTLSVQETGTYRASIIRSDAELRKAIEEGLR